MSQSVEKYQRLIDMSDCVDDPEELSFFDIFMIIVAIILALFCFPIVVSLDRENG